MYRKNKLAAAALQGRISLPTPVAIPGLIGWYRADYGVFQDSAKTNPATGSGQAVAAWIDGSGSGNDAIQTTAGAQPTYQVGVQNSLPTLRFDGVGTYLIPPNMAGRTVLFASCHNVTATKSNYYGVTGPEFLSGNSSDKFCLRKVGPGTVAYDDTLSTKAWHVVSANLLLSGAQLWIDGSLRCTLGTFSSDWAALNRIGVASTASGHWFFGDIGEVLIYANPLQNSDRTALEAYLKTRWATP